MTASPYLFLNFQPNVCLFFEAYIPASHNFFHNSIHNRFVFSICHSHTKNLKEVCQRADILVAAIGKPKFFDESYVKDGAVVIDVGIHRNAENKLCGDVDYDKVADKVSAITPVPGGVGPMTIAMLMNNCVEAALRMNNR